MESDPARALDAVEAALRSLYTVADRRERAGKLIPTRDIEEAFEVHEIALTALPILRRALAERTPAEPGPLAALIDEARRLDREMTPGEWFVDGDHPAVVDAHDADGLAEMMADCSGTSWANNADNAFGIARARTLLPALADACAKLLDERRTAGERMRERCAEVADEERRKRGLRAARQRALGEPDIESEEERAGEAADAIVAAIRALPTEES